MNNTSKGRERYETCVHGHKVCMALLGKKSEVRFRKKAGTLLKKQYVFKPVVYSAESVLTAPNDVLSDNFTVLFYFYFYFFTTIESEESIAKSSRMI